jgi:very-short-patch-repair endonuclease
MAYQSAQSINHGAWALARRQHGVVSRAQLLELGFSAKSVKHRVLSGRLHPLWRGVYAVGRPQVTRHGRWMAAVLSCGSGAALSHDDAGALYEIRPPGRGPIEVSVPRSTSRRRPGISVHRRSGLADRVTRWCGIPVTDPVWTIVDLGCRLTPDELERAVNEADKRDLIDPEALRAAIDDMPPVPGAGRVRATLDRRTFTLTDSELERRLLPIVRRAGLGRPETRCYVNRFLVDFYWPDLGLVVETDGLRYHRTPAQQARDRIRDQAHVAAGLTALRFTRAQVAFEPEHVRETLAAVGDRLRRARVALSRP